MRFALAISVIVALSGAAQASEDRGWFSDIAGCVKAAVSVQALSDCAMPQFEACLEADGYTMNASCLVAATVRIGDATNAAFARFEETCEPASEHDVCGIGLLLVQKERALGEVECRFQEQIVGYGRPELQRPLNPDENSTYAACLHVWEVSALGKLREFVSEGYDHVF